MPHARRHRIGRSANASILMLQSKVHRAHGRELADLLCRQYSAVFRTTGSLRFPARRPSSRLPSLRALAAPSANTCVVAACRLATTKVAKQSRMADQSSQMMSGNRNTGWLSIGRRARLRRASFGAAVVSREAISPAVQFTACLTDRAWRSGRVLTGRGVAGGRRGR
jgi:hypothetical protein